MVKTPRLGAVSSGASAGATSVYLYFSSLPPRSNFNLFSSRSTLSPSAGAAGAVSAGAASSGSRGASTSAEGRLRESAGQDSTGHQEGQRIPCQETVRPKEAGKSSSSLPWSGSRPPRSCATSQASSPASNPASSPASSLAYSSFPPNHSPGDPPSKPGEEKEKKMEEETQTGGETTTGSATAGANPPKRFTLQEVCLAWVIRFAHQLFSSTAKTTARTTAPYSSPAPTDSTASTAWPLQPGVPRPTPRSASHLTDNPPTRACDQTKTSSSVSTAWPLKLPQPGLCSPASTA